MIKLTIDGKQVEVEDGSTILDAAKKLGIFIPTMCFHQGCTPFSSCMICVVVDKVTGKVIPSCSALAQEGMDIISDSESVTDSRRTALELLLSDHTGDCVAPCQRVCPAKINIPAMLRHIASGEIDKASAIIRQSTDAEDPCEECKCPCEKACRRNQHDASVSIRSLVKYSLENSTSEAAAEPQKKIEFNCNIGRLIDGEMEEFLKNASSSSRIEPASGAFEIKEAQEEASRCLHCDCLKQNNCRLRDYSAMYNARQRNYSSPSRQLYRQVRQHADVIYEPGKCIKCGLCVQITEMEKEELGLSFIGRGFDVKVGVPFDESMDKALAKTAERCVKACPTAALAFRDS